MYSVTVVEVGVRRDVEVVGIGNLLRGLFARALVWGDVDPHGGGRTLCRWRRDCNRSTFLDVVCMPGGDGSRVPMRVK